MESEMDEAAVLGLSQVLEYEADKFWSSFIANMGRMHSNGKGISSSALPYRRAPPSWLKTTPEEVCKEIIKMARKGLTPSQIGVQLRDSQGIAQVRFVTGNKILRILKAEGLAPQIPEDLYHLIKKAVSVRKHLERNRKVRSRVCWRNVELLADG
jgi:small subunit ribosomal protein S13e